MPRLSLNALHLVLLLSTLVCASLRAANARTVNGIGEPHLSSLFIKAQEAYKAFIKGEDNLTLKRGVLAADDGECEPATCGDVGAACNKNAFCFGQWNITCKYDGDWNATEYTGVCQVPPADAGPCYYNQSFWSSSNFANNEREKTPLWCKYRYSNFRYFSCAPDGTCKPPGTAGAACTKFGNSETGDLVCDDNHFCAITGQQATGPCLNSGDGACEALVADGGSCRCKECLKTSYCNNQDVCAPRLVEGGNCTQGGNSVCAENFKCIQGLCRARGLDPGATCGQDNDCYKGICDATNNTARVCKAYQPVGQNCSYINSLYMKCDPDLASCQSRPDGNGYFCKRKDESVDGYLRYFTVAEGGACFSSYNCEMGLFCNAQAGGICMEPPSDVPESCTKDSLPTENWGSCSCKKFLGGYRWQAQFDIYDKDCDGDDFELLASDECDSGNSTTPGPCYKIETCPDDCVSAAIDSFKCMSHKEYGFDDCFDLVIEGAKHAYFSGASRAAIIAPVYMIVFFAIVLKFAY